MAPNQWNVAVLAAYIINTDITDNNLKWFLGQSAINLKVSAAQSSTSL